MDTFKGATLYRGRQWKEEWKGREKEEGLDKSSWACREADHLKKRT